MLNFIGKSLDRIMFACTFIIAVQLPEFMQQYGQRLAGHLAEVNYQLVKFQDIADLHYRGDLLLLIQQYNSNSDPGIKATASVVTQLIDRVGLLNTQVQHILHSDYLSSLYYFFVELNPAIAKATLHDYQLAIPLEQNAVVTGMAFALSLSLFASLAKNIFIVRPSYNNTH